MLGRNLILLLCTRAVVLMIHIIIAIVSLVAKVLEKIVATQLSSFNFVD